MPTVPTVPDDPTRSQHGVRPAHSIVAACNDKERIGRPCDSCCWHIISHRPFRLISIPARRVIG